MSSYKRSMNTAWNETAQARRRDRLLRLHREWASHVFEQDGAYRLVSDRWNPRLPDERRSHSGGLDQRAASGVASLPRNGVGRIAVVNTDCIHQKTVKTVPAGKVIVSVILFPVL
ncbi:MAG: hypothetical protein L6437_01215 [Kiritimatiellae bacterium]|nr:hypothetical protein [Kiritimatiellia bacterium]